MKIAITTETTCDLSQDLLKKYNIITIPFTVTLGERSEPDGIITGKDLIDYTMKTGQLGRTSAVNEMEYTEFFTSVLKDYDEQIHICLSSGISCAYNNAVNASEAFGGKVHVIDSRSLSTGVALECIYAAKLVEAGKSAPSSSSTKEEDAQPWQDSALTYCTSAHRS